MGTYVAKQASEYVASLVSDAGNLFFVYGEYDVGGLQSGDVIEIVKLPAGAEIVDGYVTTTADTTGGTANVGINGQDDLWSGVALDGGFHRLEKPPIEVDGTTGDEPTVKVTIGTAPSAAAKLVVGIFYILTNVG